MKIVVVSHKQAAALHPQMDGKTVMIRITSYQFRPLVFGDLYAAVHEQRFLDVEDHHAHMYEQDQFDAPITITTAQAEAIVAFIREHANADQLVVHCDAGFSRSPAIALAAADILGLEAEDLRDAIARRVFAPNSTVYLRLTEAAGLRKKRQEELNAVFGGDGSTFI